MGRLKSVNAKYKSKFVLKEYIFMSGHFKNMSGQIHVTPYILSNKVIIVPGFC